MIQPELLPDITHAIGNSPLVALDRLTDHLGLSGRILAKCYYLSPGFSKKAVSYTHLTLPTILLV